MTGTTVVTRESPWDDASQERALELAAYEETLCRCGCGQSVQVAADPEQAFKVEVATCYAGRAKAREERRRKADAKEQNKREGWDDGQHLVVVPVDLDDDPLRGGARAHH